MHRISRIWIGIALLAVAVMTMTCTTRVSEFAKKEEMNINKKLIIGDAEVLYPDLSKYFKYIDGTPATLIYDENNIEFFYTCGYETKRSYGPLNDPFQNALPNVTLNMNGFSGTAWLMNIYKVSDSNLIGFMHRETSAGQSEGMFYSGIGYSTNNGASWTYLGDVLSPYRNDRAGSNMGGVPYIIVGDYFYIYFNEHTSDFYRYISVARALVSDVIKAAQSNTVTSFNKYSSGSWVNGMKGLASPVIADSSILTASSSDANWKRSFDSHTDATYCSALDKYLLLIQTHSLGYLLLYTSTNGIDWAEETVVDYDPSGLTIHAYCCFAGLTGVSDDASTVGSEFYIYYPRKPWPGQGVETYYRRLVTVGNLSTTKYKASADFSATQNSHCWSYQQWNGSAYSNMTWNGPYCRWTGIAVFAIVGYNCQHPDSSYDSVRTWTSPSAGSLKITGTAKKQAGQTEGDGVVVTIKKNIDSLWTKTISGSNTTGYSHSVSTNVSIGDKIYFIVNKNSTITGDTTEWDPTIEYQ